VKQTQIVRSRALVRIALCALLLTAVAGSAEPAAAQLFDAEAAEPRIAPLESSESPLNVVKTMANHPKLAEAWMGFASYILGDNTLPVRDRELLILRTAFLRGAEYEWGHHARLASQAGVSEEEILRVMKGGEAAGWSSFDRALLRAADELQRNAYISDRTWAYLDARYDDKQLMDVVFTVGQYNLVSMALKTFRVPMDEGLEGFPE
jgi:alkylhydroperoxidase family enzyme